MSDTIPVICWVYGDKKSPPVEISREKIVGQLKEAIVTKNPNQFQGIDAKSLDLWKVEIPDNGDAINQNFEFKASDILRPTQNLKRYFTGISPKILFTSSSGMVSETPISFLTTSTHIC